MGPGGPMGPGPGGQMGPGPGGPRGEGRDVGAQPADLRGADRGCADIVSIGPPFYTINASMQDLKIQQQLMSRYAGTCSIQHTMLTMISSTFSFKDDKIR